MIYYTFVSAPFRILKGGMCRSNPASERFLNRHHYSDRSSRRLAFSAGLWFCSLCFLAACNRGTGGAEYAYVAAPQVSLRDRVSAVYNKVGEVKNAERVEVLEHSKRFVRVRSLRNEEGWMEQRYLVDQTIYNLFEKMARSHAESPAQARATTRAEANMHIVPGRETEKLFQLGASQKVDLLERASVAKQLPGAALSSVVKKGPPVAKGKQGRERKLDEEEPAAPQEDWWLVRDSQKRVGWVLGRILDVDVPLEIAQYAEGQRIVSSFVLTEVRDPYLDRADQTVAYYLVLTTEPKDGLPFDFNQIRIFSWNLKRHRYETAYREHDLFGVLPVKAGKENFENEGVLPFFAIHIKDRDGAVTERKYKLNGNLVRRVVVPGQAPLLPTRQPHQRKLVPAPPLR